MSLIISAIAAASLGVSSDVTTEKTQIQSANLISELTKVTLTKLQDLKQPETNVNTGATSILKPAAFDLYAEQNRISDALVEIQINSEDEMQSFIEELFTQLPTKVKMTSNIYTASELKSLYDKALSETVEDAIPTIHGLANFNMKVNKNALILTDTTNNKYNAATIKAAVDAYVKDVVSGLKADTEYGTINNIYDYLFENFKYNANGIQYMLVGNLGNSAMACNGFSYLVDKLFEEAGIQSSIRGGYSHYWNVLTLSDGSELTFDITSDIVLKQYKATLGLSTQEHISKVAGIGFYSAEYPPSKYSNVQSNTKFLAAK